MKLIAVVWLLLIQNTLISQINSIDFVKAKSVTVICKVQLTNEDHSKLYSSSGCGFILNSKYLVTCYHIYKERPDMILKRFTVIYNIRYFKNKLVYDSVDVDLNYKYSKNQYDFSKHIYNHNDESTDVIVLKLKNTISMPKENLSKKIPKLSETLYSFGFSRTKNMFSVNYDSSASSVLYIFKPKSNNADYIASLGTHHEGFSGSPVLNFNGQIIGMTQTGIQQFPDMALIEIFKKKGLSSTLYNKIEIGYSNGLRIGNSITMKYLIDKYLKGFITYH